jgi:hypothetical protein
MYKNELESDKNTKLSEIYNAQKQTKMLQSDKTKHFENYRQ